MTAFDDLKRSTAPIATSTRRSDLRVPYTFWLATALSVLAGLDACRLRQHEDRIAVLEATCAQAEAAP